MSISDLRECQTLQSLRYHSSCFHAVHYESLRCVAIHSGELQRPCTESLVDCGPDNTCPAIVTKVDHLVVGRETAVEKLVAVASTLDFGERGAFREMPQSLLAYQLDDFRTDLRAELLDGLRFENAFLQKLAVFLRLGYLLVAQLKQPHPEQIEGDERGGPRLEDDAHLLRNDGHYLFEVVNGRSHLSPRLVQQLDGDAVHVLERVVGPHQARDELVAYL